MEWNHGNGMEFCVFWHVLYSTVQYNDHVMSPVARDYVLCLSVCGKCVCVLVCTCLSVSVCLISLSVHLFSVGKN